MKKYFVNIIIGSSFVIIFTFLAVFFFEIFLKLFFGSDSALSNGTAAFAGAFFSFLFVRIGDWLTRIYERQRKAYNALIKYEKLGNDCLETAGTLLFVFDDMKRSAQESILKKAVSINFNEPRKFEINDDFISDLSNIELINKIYIFNIHLKKLNGSIAAIYRQYSQVIEMFMEGKINSFDFEQNMRIFIEKADEIKNFINENIEENKQIISMVRVLSRNQKPIFTKLTSILYKKRLDENIIAESKSELIKLNDEINSNRQVSQESISKVIKH